MTGRVLYDGYFPHTLTPVIPVIHDRIFRQELAEYVHGYSVGGRFYTCFLDQHHLLPSRPVWQVPQV